MVTKVGIHEQYQGAKATTFARTASRFPGTEITREFEGAVLSPQDMVGRLVLRCQPIWQAGKTAVWSFKPNPADVTSGAWKPHIQALAQYIKDNRLQDKVIVVIWHEPENDVPKWFRNGSEFSQYFNTVQRWLFEVDPSIVTSHAALGYAYRNLSIGQAKAWVTECTIHSIDIYSGRSFPLGMTLGNSRAFATWKASRPKGARWGVSERGWIADESRSEERAASIKAEADYLASLSPVERPDFYVVWNTEGTENDPKIILDDAGTAAVNVLFGRLSTVICPLCSGVGNIPSDKQFTLTEP
jgi:hypothetical protein